MVCDFFVIFLLRCGAFRTLDLLQASIVKRTNFKQKNRVDESGSVDMFVVVAAVLT